MVSRFGNDASASSCLNSSAVSCWNMSSPSWMPYGRLRIVSDPCHRRTAAIDRRKLLDDAVGIVFQFRSESIHALSVSRCGIRACKFDRVPVPPFRSELRGEPCEQGSSFPLRPSPIGPAARSLLAKGAAWTACRGRTPQCPAAPPQEREARNRLSAVARSYDALTLLSEDHLIN